MSSDTMMVMHVQNTLPKFHSIPFKETKQEQKETSKDLEWTQGVASGR